MRDHSGDESVPLGWMDGRCIDKACRFYTTRLEFTITLSLYTCTSFLLCFALSFRFSKPCFNPHLLSYISCISIFLLMTMERSLMSDVWLLDGWSDDQPDSSFRLRLVHFAPEIDLNPKAANSRYIKNRWLYLISLKSYHFLYHHHHHHHFRCHLICTTQMNLVLVLFVVLAFSENKGVGDIGLETCYCAASRTGSSKKKKRARRLPWLPPPPSVASTLVYLWSTQAEAAKQTP